MSDVFPTCVGMNRPTIRRTHIRVGVPHVRGDEPLKVFKSMGNWLCSPRAWG